MGSECNKIKIFSSQTETVSNAIKRDGICFSKEQYVVRKYGESAPIFVAAYSWFVSKAQEYVKKPEGAEYPYWAFKDLYNIDPSVDSKVISLEVPIDEAIFFDMHDWNKIICLKYIPETEEDEKKFKEKLLNYGVKQESDVILTNFYPELKREVQDSWQKLFRHHEDIKNGNYDGVKNIQVGLWCIKKEWII